MTSIDMLRNQLTVVERALDAYADDYEHAEDEDGEQYAHTMRGAAHRLRDDLTRQLAEELARAEVKVTVHANGSGSTWAYTIISYFGEWGAHYEMDRLIAEVYPAHIAQGDSESGQFFAYAKDADTVESVARFVARELERQGYRVTVN